MYDIPLIRPFLDEYIKKSVLDVLDSGYLTEGSITKKFEQAIAEYTYAKHALAVTNCTVGLEIALRALKIKEGDEVIVPDYTYPATGSAVLLTGATAVVVDIDPATMNIDYDALEAAITPRTRGILPVSLFGNPLDWKRLNEIKQKHDLFIVEDAACSLGAEYEGKKVGTFADISVFSMHPRKFITTGEGGIITTDSDKLGSWMNSFKHFGANIQDSREKVIFERVGTNAKLSNVLAAIGLGQMAKIKELLSERRLLAENYISLLDGEPGIQLPLTTVNGLHSYQSFCVFVDNRDKIIERIRTQGVEVQIGTYQLSTQPAFHNHKQCRLADTMTGSAEAFDKCLTLPLFSGMLPQEQERVVNLLKTAVQSLFSSQKRTLS
ncbi:DegT/DnrJ/EryC1/StrS family aminotransferase [Maridesulfovibrio sp.]|uniref:DegT/DnrJ/EryC1/StrS family aminotransferase n=1 Tax=Maridesulfovibrio sp. TaxID=2795000 RepID=UPI0029C9BCB9|nr:DegT/DnrJ/EryC1/StrS family aminotransferase [Maridesulfovibrio sp.]